MCKKLVILPGLNCSLDMKQISEMGEETVHVVFKQGTKTRIETSGGAGAGSGNGSGSGLGPSAPDPPSDPESGPEADSDLKLDPDPVSTAGQK
jgi:hypothetical protein